MQSKMVGSIDRSVFFAALSSGYWIKPLTDSVGGFRQCKRILCERIVSPPGRLDSRVQ